MTTACFTRQHRVDPTGAVNPGGGRGCTACRVGGRELQATASASSWTRQASLPTATLRLLYTRSVGGLGPYSSTSTVYRTVSPMCPFSAALRRALRLGPACVPAVWWPFRCHWATVAWVRRTLHFAIGGPWWALAHIVPAREQAPDLAEKGKAETLRMLPLHLGPVHRIHRRHRALVDPGQ